MAGEITPREQLEVAAKRASEKQPDEIHLLPVEQHGWSNADAIEAHAAGLRGRGFTEAGTYAVDALPVMIRFLVKESERIYAAIYEHPKAGVWLNLVILHEDGTSLTLTNTQDRGLEKRPGHQIVYVHKAVAGQLYALALQAAAGPARRVVTASTIPDEFEKAWADGIRWRKARGISVTEAASVVLSRDGQPSRMLRKDRIQFIAEQDGPPERVLKDALSKVFEAHPSVEKAWLVLAGYDNASEIHVALCLFSASPDEVALIGAVRQTFARSFAKGTHLDILFVSTSDLKQLESICAPFYPR